MIDHDIAARYAQALFFIVRDRHLVDVAYEQMGALETALIGDPALVGFLTAPQIADDKKEALLARVFKERFHPALYEFLLLVARKRRAGALREIVSRFRDLVSEARGEVKVTVTSVYPLLSDQRTELFRRLEAKLKKKIRLDERRDPRALGGMKVVIGDQAIDGTVRTALTNLRQRLLAIEVA